MDLTQIIHLAIALGLGLLVGLQREWSDSDTAGIRTFAFVSLLGAMLVNLPAEMATWAVATGLLSITALLVLINVSHIQRGETEFGLTTEVAALVMYCVGAAAGCGQTVPAVVVGGVTALFLYWKQPLHRFVDQIGESDFKAIAHLVLIGLVILPILPDETFGPYEVLNPYKIWLMVVLIVGISLCAYAAQRIWGTRDGSVMAGILGGLVSSTATTISYARQTRKNSQLAAVAAMVIMLASTVVNIRALIEIGVVAPELLKQAAAPLLALTGVMVVLCLPIYFLSRRTDISPPEMDNPAQLKAAVVFGLLYALILFVVAAVKDRFGEQALYAVAVISGLTDVDAITLSTAKLYGDSRIEASFAWRIVLLAVLSNLVFKGVAAAVLGSRKLGVYVALLFLLTLVAGGSIFWFWPT